MLKKMIFLVPVAVLVALGFSQNFGSKFSSSMNSEIFAPLDTTFQIQPNEILEKKSSVVVALLNSRHYKKMTLNDSVSSVIFNNFIEDLDESKLYLLASDLKEFEKYRFKLDDELRQSSRNLNIPFLIYNRYLERVYARMERNNKLLKEKYDFTTDEYIETDRKKATWVQNETEGDEEWRKLLKNQILTSKLAGEKPEEIVSKLQKRYERYNKTITQLKAEDVLQAYMNAVTMAYDPHTSYLSPISQNNFNLTMKKSLEGIGAGLNTENDYTVIRSVRPGSPAFKSKKIFEKDRIVGVAQGDEGEMIDVVGWRLDEVIQLIRGKQGTAVRLSILSAKDGANAKPIEVKMIREKITLEEQSSTKQVIEYEKDGKLFKVAVLSVPGFYINFDEYREGKPDYKSTTNDVKKLLQECQAENVNSVIIDLRFNGGGSLKEAIDLGSLFIKSGAMVQVKDGNGKSSAGEPEDFSQVYKGALVVMTNRFSASASEIFAGAIQDYKRGVVVGEQTYGKGTVQNALDLSRLITEYGDNIGQLNLTVSKYYRAAGSSVQNKGVTPDLKLASVFDEDFGESSYKSSLPWDEIKPAYSFKATNEVSENNLKKLKTSFQKRLTTDPDLRKIIETTEKAKKDRLKTKMSLNEAKRKAEKDETKKDSTDQKDEIETEDAAATETKKKTTEKYQNLKDLYLKNAVLIAVELAQLTK
jgi:carboxyl-terminal processing protease